MSDIVLIEADMPNAICLVLDGQVVYQSPCPAVDDMIAWSQTVNGLRARLYMEQKLDGPIYLKPRG